MAENSEKSSGTRKRAGKRELTPQARRALEEAEQRRAAAREPQQKRPKEVGGRNGPDPARYGDWEKDGIVSDF